MGRITIFTKNDCHFCVRAKRELQYRCLPFVEISLGAFPGKKTSQAPSRSLVKGEFHVLPRGTDGTIELILDPAVAVVRVDRRDDMLNLSGRLTVPQIFFNETWVGGCEDLMDLLEKWDGEEVDPTGVVTTSNSKPPCEGNGDEEDISGQILKNTKIWRRFQADVASMPDPTDPRLALPAPLVHKGEKHGSSGNLHALVDETDMTEFGEETNFGCINLPDGTCASIREVTNDLLEHMPRQKLAYLAKFYNDCFQGEKGVDALLRIYPFERPSDNGDPKIARAKAVAFGRILQKYGIMHHVCNEHLFHDTGAYYYRLQPFHQPHVLNSFQSLHRVIENMPKDSETPTSFLKLTEEETEHAGSSSPLVLTPDGALQLLTNLQKLLSNIESRNTGRDGVDFLSCKNYDDPDFLLLEEGSCQLQCMDAVALASTMSDAQKMVFGIHLYNIMVRHAYIKMGVPIKANQRGAFFTGVCYNVANQILSLDDVEHGIIRANTRHPYHVHKQFQGDDLRRAWAVSKLDPRIHFTLFCGANSCPPISSYTVENLENELQLAAESFCQEDSNVMLDEANGTIHVSMLFKWYGKDFGVSKDRDLAAKILTYLPKRGEKYRALSRMFRKKSGSFTGLFRNNSTSPTRNGKDIKIKFLPYDWGSKAAPGKCLEFKGSILKNEAMSFKAPFMKTATAFTGGGCVPAS